MKILISGASGLVGKALTVALENSGDQVSCLVRDKNKVSEKAIFWDPENNLIDSASLEGFDAVINLAGENLTSGRWTEDQKKKLLKSRLDSTNTLVNAISHLKQPPKVFVSASAIGFYGNRGNEIVTEDSNSGSGFLANVCRQWEEATKPAAEHGIRTVNLRIGVVLTPNGGALAKMLTPFKLGLGGKLGSGDQFMSWIALDDLIGIILFVLSNDSVKGPINAVAPTPVTNAELTNILGNVLNRPTVLSVPEFALKFLLGNEMAEEVLLSSTRVDPLILINDGYIFKYPDLKLTLVNILEQGRNKMEKEYGPKSDKSFVATLLFCILLGTLGVHRFYVGKIGTGLLMLITFGGFGIWWLIDLILVACLRFRDKQGFLIEP